MQTFYYLPLSHVLYYFSTFSLLNSFILEGGENTSIVSIRVLCQKCDAAVDGFFFLALRSRWGHLYFLAKCPTLCSSFIGLLRSKFTIYSLLHMLGTRSLFSLLTLKLVLPSSQGCIHH